MNIFKISNLFKTIVPLTFLCGPAFANDATMFVFDASGSMWGQIEGRSKIETARTAFREIGQNWQGKQTGLIAYGHRRKGDCRDIETIVPLSKDGYGAVAGAIASLTPKGKTPLSAAVRQAAEHLKFEENAATVILFSDGIETCDADPCALASQLDTLGIDFTAHVIGFGIASKDDKAKLQCIANNTGGTYRDASDAGSLKDALNNLAKEQAPKTEEEATGSTQLTLTLALGEGTVRPDEVSFRAINQRTGKKQLLGKLQGADQILTGLSAKLAHGHYQIEAISPEGKGSVDAQINGKSKELAVPFTAGAASFSLLDQGPYQLGIEHSFFLHAEGALQSNAEYSVQLMDPANKTRIDQEYRFGSDGAGLSWHTFASPAKAGTYEVQVIQDGKILSRSPVAYVADHTPTWTGDLDGAPGGKLKAGITGNLYYSNQLVLRQNGQEIQSTSLENLITPQGLFLTLPAQSGTYDLSYIHTDAADNRVETNLTTLRVGDVTLPDDPDSVAAPTDQSNISDKDRQVFEVKNTPSTADPATLRKVTQDQMSHYCADQDLCLIDIPRLGASKIPLLRGFGLNGASDDGRGRPTFTVFNVENGEWLIHNPTFMQQLTDCIGYGPSGERDPDHGPTVDSMCILRDSNGRSVYQFELLEEWTSNRLAASNAAMEKKAKASGHLDADGHGPDMADLSQSLFGDWTLTTLDQSKPLGMIRFEPTQNNAETTGMISLQNQALIRMPPVDIALPKITLQRDGAEGDVYSIQFEGGEGAQKTNVLLNRPGDWDGQAREYVGVLVTNGYKAQFKVRAFKQ
ncbi:vWA domain-containing protein [Cohaesibacter gelatinilyticus]|uniref:von Willebrand factor type A domain-containing protein n=1 Tax=Cohaesibacter gelatinilyticus TaxID=372072 RepID=A0A285PD68_9HYPH|nr:VWA domain-containing protein [Cohaesibacter gelatinilyticus]SNZ19659.1 von Willebrand factor type A domain-containing protein [Cohaesibacter gelatinilyticus]